MTRLVLLIVSGLLIPSPILQADEASWEYRLAKKLSPRLAAIEEEIGNIEKELPSFPRIPVDDQRGTGGFASMHSTAEPTEEGSYSVDVRIQSDEPLDMVALVPARRYEVSGLDPQFGLPDAFTVDLLSPEGKVLQRIADERDLWADPVRAGHPFIFEVSPPVVTGGIRISATRLQLDGDVSDSYVHAWSEAFLFSGEKNLASGAEVIPSNPTGPTSPWQWNKGYLVDGQTPLGLPERPGPPHANVGWLSAGTEDPSKSTWLELDLGRQVEFDSVILYPARRPTADLPSGFGFPGKFSITYPRGYTPLDEKSAASTIVEMANPGHNPVQIYLGPRKSRLVRITATQLWKEYENYPAFFALSEVEVLNGDENQARDAKVKSPHSMGNLVAPGSRYWSVISLTDGFGPDGELVPRRDWLVSLNDRLLYETRRYELQTEAREIVSGWRRTGLVFFIVMGIAGASVIIILPLRYRAREKRELAKVRDSIAGDLHDEVGSNLGSIQMFADLAEGRSGESEELKRIQRIAAETVSAVRDIVWLLRPQGDHRIGTVEHLRETSSIMLEPLDWKFTANEEAWQGELSDEQNRHLFLFFREALHNILRHAQARKVSVRVEQDAERFFLAIEDDGRGIDEKRMARKSTLRALRQRVAALDAHMDVITAAGEGTRLELSIPLAKKRHRRKRV